MDGLYGKEYYSDNIAGNFVVSILDGKRFDNGQIWGEYVDNTSYKNAYYTKGGYNPYYGSYRNTAYKDGRCWDYGTGQSFPMGACYSIWGDDIYNTVIGWH